MRRHFHKINLIGEFNDKKKPVLLIANHVSWWDGFWLMYFNLKVLKRKFHFMMLEDQLRKHWFFNYSGGFSVKKNSRSIVESLQYTREILNNPENMVFMFPQGKIHSIYEQKIDFEKGIERVIAGKENDIQIVMICNLVDYFSQPKPELSIFFKENGRDNSAKNLQSEYQSFYSQSIELQKLKAE
ncbi:MAG: lysophospholipid acyltransferase family protein [Bacteroidales bacterium]|nr:lysophospholipid acyltransferase family protein [Bacteroidales bacterium]